MPEFAENLKELMVTQDVGIEELSKAIEDSASNIYGWLRGEHLPNFRNMIRLADYFHCSIDLLLGLVFLDPEPYTFRPNPSFFRGLTKAMKLKRMTQARFCRDTKTSRSTFHIWQTGKTVPSWRKMIALADFFDCTLDSLIDRES